MKNRKKEFRVSIALTMWQLTFNFWLTIRNTVVKHFYRKSGDKKLFEYLISNVNTKQVNKTETTMFTTDHIINVLNKTAVHVLQLSGALDL